MLCPRRRHSPSSAAARRSLGRCLPPGPTSAAGLTVSLSSVRREPPSSSPHVFLAFPQLSRALLLNPRSDLCFVFTEVDSFYSFPQTGLIPLEFELFKSSSLAMERQPATLLQRGVRGWPGCGGNPSPDLQAKAPWLPLPPASLPFLGGSAPRAPWKKRREGWGCRGTERRQQVAHPGPPRPDRTLRGECHRGRGRSATAPATQLPGMAAITGSHCCPGLWQGPTQGPRAVEGA